MKLDMGSVLKAGGFAAVAAILMGAISGGIAMMPLGDFLNLVLAPFYCFGALLIPIGAGMAYGYFAPGKENLVEGIVGGVLTGGVAGLLYGLINGTVTMFTAGVMDGLLITVSTGCMFALGGVFFGAIGGVIWPQIQNMVEGR
ncbi:hypothetical protein QUF58_00935 [Anaerolineales bacterium HSG24]|nr:hypothetical protein [Anaerolineales bacterium HSG24]